MAVCWTGAAAACSGFGCIPRAVPIPSLPPSFVSALSHPHHLKYKLDHSSWPKNVGFHLENGSEGCGVGRGQRGQGVPAVLCASPSLQGKTFLPFGKRLWSTCIPQDHPRVLWASRKTAPAPLMVQNPVILQKDEVWIPVALPLCASQSFQLSSEAGWVCVCLWSSNFHSNSLRTAVAEHDLVSSPSPFLIILPFPHLSAPLPFHHSWLLLSLQLSKLSPSQP